MDGLEDGDQKKRRPNGWMTDLTSGNPVQQTQMRTHQQQQSQQHHHTQQHRRLDRPSQHQLASLTQHVVLSADHLPTVNKRLQLQACPPASLARRRGAPGDVLKRTNDVGRESSVFCHLGLRPQIRLAMENVLVLHD